MPRILTKRAGTCSVCRGRVGKGEFAEFTAAGGLVHLECVGKGEPVRTNAKPARCRKCSVELAPGMGRLTLVETQRAGAFEKDWRVTCLRGC